MNDIPKIAIWYSAGYSLNQGDRAILASIVQNIRNFIPEAEIYCFSPNKDVEKLHKIKVIPMGLRNIRKQMWMLRQMDVLLWGGGNMLQESSFFFLPYQLTRIVMAKLCGVPVMVYGMGVGPFHSSINKWLAAYFANRIDLITVRDENSKYILQDLGVDKTPIRVTADPAIRLIPASKEKVEETLIEEEGFTEVKRPLIGISVRRWFNYRYGILPVGLSLRLGLWAEGGKEKFENFKRLMSEIGDHLVEKYDANLLFIPMYLGTGQEDDVVSHEIIETMENKERARVLKKVYPSGLLKGIIGATDLFIGVRMHSTILATSSLVPTVSIFYAKKGEEYFRRLNQLGRCIDIEEVTADKVRDLVDDTWENRERVREDLKNQIARASGESHQTVLLLKELLNEREN